MSHIQFIMAIFNAQVSHKIHKYLIGTPAHFFNKIAIRLSKFMLNGIKINIKRIKKGRNQRRVSHIHSMKRMSSMKSQMKIQDRQAGLPFP